MSHIGKVKEPDFMNRYIKLSCVCILLLVCMLFAASCKKEQKNHVCGEWITVKEPTCQDKGIRSRVCTVCGEEETEEINIVAHKYNEVRHCIWCNKQEASESLKYSLSSDGKSYLVTGYSGHKADVVIPCEYNGLPVSGIADSAFEKNSVITTLYIHSSMTSIGKNAFLECRSLVSVSLPDSITKIGENAFLGCEKLLEVMNHTNIDLEKGSDENGCVAKYAKFIHSDSRSKIQNENGYLYFVDGDVSLLAYVGENKDIVLPDSLAGLKYEVYDKAFAYSSITSVEITDGAAIVGNYAFASCSSLAKVTLSARETIFYASVFENCIFLKEVVIADHVTALGESMFRNCASIKEITLPKSLVTLESSVFRFCTSLTRVEFLSPVREIGEYAFYGCTSLTDIVMAEGSGMIGMYAFASCSGLKTVELPASVSEIGDFAFYSCSSLESIKAPAELAKIGNYAFKDCTALTKISYDKTMLKWGGISKGVDWNANTGKIAVSCSDGTV